MENVFVITGYTYRDETPVCFGVFKKYKDAKKELNKIIRNDFFIMYREAHNKIYELEDTEEKFRKENTLEQIQENYGELHLDDFGARITTNHNKEIQYIITSEKIF